MDLEAVAKRLRAFTEARDWEQFHSPKNLSMALAGETGELLEVFQWLTEEESRSLGRDSSELQRVREEVADILIYLVRICDQLNIDLESAVWTKIETNEAKYPEALSRGTAKKYTEI